MLKARFRLRSLLTGNAAIASLPAAATTNNEFCNKRQFGRAPPPLSSAQVNGIAGKMSIAGVGATAS
jgi:hypothetical protein